VCTHVIIMSCHSRINLALRAKNTAKKYNSYASFRYHSLPVHFAHCLNSNLLLCNVDCRFCIGKEIQDFFQTFLSNLSLLLNLDSL